jgi:hypothetical protein
MMKRPSKKMSKRLGTYSKEQDEFIDWQGMQIITKDGENQLLMDEIKELKEYATHKRICAIFLTGADWEDKCTCGLEQALKK